MLGGDVQHAATLLVARRRNAWQIDVKRACVRRHQQIGVHGARSTAAAASKHSKSHLSQFVTATMIYNTRL
jgi:hypothetical protein